MCLILFLINFSGIFRSVKFNIEHIAIRGTNCLCEVIN